jgi:hypothetical protein
MKRKGAAGAAGRGRGMAGVSVKGKPVAGGFAAAVSDGDGDDMASKKQRGGRGGNAGRRSGKC